MYKLICFALLLLISCKKQVLDADSQTLNPDITIHDMLFVDDTLAFAIGGIQYVTYALYRSEDAGTSWTELRPSSMKECKILYDIRFQHGILYMSGADGKIVHSTDTGKTWHSFQNQSWADIYSLSYLNPEKGIATSTYANGGKMLVVNSYGDNTEIQNFSTTLNSLHVWDNQRMVAGGSGIIMYTEDGAEYWEASDADGDIFVDLNENNGELFAIGYFGKILKSKDKGKTWKKVNEIRSNGSEAKLRKCLTLQDGRQIIVGDESMVYITSDNWNKYETFQISDKKENLLGVCQSPQGQIMLMGSGGLILSNVNL